MGLIRSSYCLFAVAMLIDVAPGPSGGCHSSEPESGYLRVQVSDCSCTGGEILVDVDGRFSVTITCGEGGGQDIEVRAGYHSVSATSGSQTWTSRSYYVSEGMLLVELGCPDS